MKLRQVIEEIRKEPLTNKQRGDCFEKIVKHLLKKDPRYKDLFSEVLLWDEWPEREEADTGVDLVAKEHAGQLWAIQCKFYEPNHPLKKSSIDSFFTTSGRYGFSQRVIVSTTDNWSTNAENALKNQTIPCERWGIRELEESPVEWENIYRPEKTTIREKKRLLPHQLDALNDVVKGLETADRGKLIMACGTGKTLTSLKIAERIVPENGKVLFLVPSISLLSQSLREWATEAEAGQRNFAVCSDSKVGKDSEDIRAYELAFPTTTNHETLAQKLKEESYGRTNIVFSTYHSIDVVAKAQQLGAPEFDLVICDEAHRTTGVKRKGEEASYFTKIHNDDFVKAKKRLYMTATPRIYSDSAKAKAQEHDIEYFSMDKEKDYGKELHRLDFSDAVERGLLSDYRVLVLAVNESRLSPSIQQQFVKDGELELEDAAKIIGCWNGLSKRIINPDEAAEMSEDPMRRAVSFANTIKKSEQITEMFSDIVTKYQADSKDESFLKCEFRHVDGKQNSLIRDNKIDWLKQDAQEDGKVCRVLSNARCLSEGVDVPALDAVMFLNPRKSVVDVVQSVGRVMRKAEGKQYGYVILPIGVPAGIPADEALEQNERYKVVWQVLQALRAHDNRFNATINKLELNKQLPKQIQVIGVGFEAKDGEGRREETEKAVRGQLSLDIEELRDAIYAKIVAKCGDRRYWESWAKDVARIAESNTVRIRDLLESTEHKARFAEFLKGLQANINPSITEEEAIEMLSQHLITKPVFNALFEDYDFAGRNPVSKTMQAMIDLLEGENLDAETRSLEKFYKSVRERAAGIDNAEGKQKIIIELYDKFFRTAFPKMTERLGIVYTPVEIVDFILQSAEDLMQKEFGKSLSDKGVDILDPFTGTGSFIVRLLQGGYIKDGDLKRKYESELHANEIILLAYYIAAINIEEAYHFRSKDGYEPFGGILLSDTFQMYEKQGWDDNFFPENYERAKKQKERNIRVIVGNPPYSAGQRSENDANKNLKYPRLDEQIRNTYAKHSSATLKNSLYDSYIRSIRWAGDRIGDEGIVAFVSNGSYIEGNATDGMRKCLADDFSSIYCFNLRGNQRTSGELSRKEGGKIFGSGSRATIAITLFVKNPKHRGGECKIYYTDIGDYLKQDEKLEKIKKFSGVNDVDWREIRPNKQHDWINPRHPEFQTFMPMGDKENKKKSLSAPSVFSFYCRGLSTARDAWVYNFSKEKLQNKMKSMIDFYNDELIRYQQVSEENDFAPDMELFISNDKTKISWDGTLKEDFKKTKIGIYSDKKIRPAVYRPFSKQWVYFDRQFNNSVYRMPQFFPAPDTENLAICVSGKGTTKDFSALMVDTLPDLSVVDKSDCFPLYTYEETNSKLFNNINTLNTPPHERIENIPDTTLKRFRSHYKDESISKIDIFHYVYGLLHSAEYRTKYAADLKKMLPRIPMEKDFRTFSNAGKALGELHINYENAEEYPLEEVSADLGLDKEDRKVIKMTFGKKDGKPDKSTIVYNSRLSLKGIPPETYKYIVNGKPALEWIMERYQVKIDKDTQIKNDPNDWSGNPDHIISLLKKVVKVSVESVRIVEGLPGLGRVTNSTQS